MCRIIHANQRSPFKPALRLFASELRQHISVWPHIIIDTADLVRKLHRIVVPSRCCCAKLDIKDFYMSGLHEDHVASTMKYVTLPRREAKDILTYLCFNQYVQACIDGVMHTYIVDVGYRHGHVGFG